MIFHNSIIPALSSLDKNSKYTSKYTIYVLIFRFSYCIMIFEIIVRFAVCCYLHYTIFFAFFSQKGEFYDNFLLIRAEFFIYEHQKIIFPIILHDSPPKTETDRQDFSRHKAGSHPQTTFTHYIYIIIVHLRRRTRQSQPGSPLFFEFAIFKTQNCFKFLPSKFIVSIQSVTRFFDSVIKIM